MEKRKTICIIRSNSVDPDSRVEKEAATLKKAGYNVIILAWDRSSNHKTIHNMINVYDESIDIYRLGCKASFGAGMKSIVPYLQFQVKQFCWLIKNNNKIDAIHACDFDTAFFSSIANIFIKKKFVFDIFDFICGNPRNLIEKCVKRIEYSIINNADATIICTEKRRMQINGSTPHNLTIIHNTPIMIGDIDIIRSNDQDNKIKVAYVGVLQDYRLLIEMSDVFKKNSEIELHIGGFGKYEGFFKNLSKECNNVFFYGKLSYMQTLELEKKCDIMLAIYDPQIENHVYAAPNKFYESLMLGKPVIMVKGTGMSELVNKYNIGSLIDYSVESFEKGLNDLISRRQEWKDIGERMNKVYTDEFSWTVMDQRLQTMYRNIFPEKNI